MINNSKHTGNNKQKLTDKQKTICLSCEKSTAVELFPGTEEVC